MFAARGGCVEPGAGTSVCPLCPVLLGGRGLPIASSDADCWLHRGLLCSIGGEEAEDEEEEEEEGGRGMS